MARLYSEGKNTIEIGEIFKVGPSTINQILRRRKVKLRRGGVRCSKAKYSWVDRNGRACQFRSSWEVLVARILDERGLDWKYEEKTYPLKSLTPRGRHRSYTPDFWVYDKSGALIKVIDVKGRMKPEQMARVKEFELLYPGLPFELWDENFLKSMGLTWAALHVPSVAVSGALFA